MKKIILASTSPRRRELLSKLKIKYEIFSPNYEEDMTLELPPLELAKVLSKWKANAAVNEIGDIENTIIIAADTFIALDNDILWKPHTPDVAEKTLKKISWKTLSVITGFTVINNNKEISKSVETKVFMKNLTDSEIKNYIATGEPLDKAWAFGIQDLWVIFVEKIEGDYTNVIWLPLFELSKTLKDFWIEII